MTTETMAIPPEVALVVGDGQRSTKQQVRSLVERSIHTGVYFNIRKHPVLIPTIVNTYEVRKYLTDGVDSTMKK